MRTGLAHQDVRDDFDRARRRAAWATLAGWLHGHPSSRNRLAVLGEVTTFTGGPGPGARRLEYEGAGHLGPTAEALVPIDCELAAALVARSADHFQGWSDVVIFAACTAARIGEVSGIRCANINLNAWIWTVRRQTSPSLATSISVATTCGTPA
jgi:integrase